MASIVSAGTTSATALNMSADTSGVLQLASNNGTVALTVATSQYIGIGTATPASTLNIYGTSTAPSATVLSSATLNVQGTSTLRLLFGTNPSSPYGAWIQTTDGAGAGYPISLNPLGGNVGVGTLTPTANSGTSFVLYDASTPRFRLTNSTTGQAAGDGAELSLFNSNFNIETRENANIIYYLNGAERSRMTPVGTTETATYNSGSLYAGDGVYTISGVSTVTFDLATLFPDLVGLGAGTGIIMQIYTWNGGVNSGQTIIVAGQKSSGWSFSTVGGASASSNYTSSSGSGTSITVNFGGTVYGQIRISCITRN